MPSHPSRKQRQRLPKRYYEVKNSIRSHFLAHHPRFCANTLTAPSTTPNHPKAPQTSPQEREIIDLSVEVVAKTITRPGNDEFPRFSNGDVYIELGSLDLKSTYQLHSNILRRVSPWFNKTLIQHMKELDDEIAMDFTKITGVSARYEMIYNSDLNVPVLVRTVSIHCNPSPRLSWKESRINLYCEMMFIFSVGIDEIQHS